MYDRYQQLSTNVYWFSFIFSRVFFFNYENNSKTTKEKSGWNQWRRISLLFSYITNCRWFGKSCCLWKNSSKFLCDTNEWIMMGSVLSIVSSPMILSLINSQVIVIELYLYFDVYCCLWLCKWTVRG